MSVMLNRYNTERPAQCGAWVKLLSHHVSAVRRFPLEEPWYDGWVNDSATCGRRFGHDGWHESGMRPLDEKYGGTEVGIRWKRYHGYLSPAGFQVVVLGPLSAVPAPATD